VGTAAFGRAPSAARQPLLLRDVASQMIESGDIVAILEGVLLTAVRVNQLLR